MPYLAAKEGGRVHPPFGKHVRSAYGQEAKEAPFGGSTYGDSKV